ALYCQLNCAFLADLCRLFENLQNALSMSGTTQLWRAYAISSATIGSLLRLTGVHQTGFCFERL
ncbi:MAG: hypothetical protein ACYCPA_09950, partial [Acidithiobacillus sp.]